LQIYNLILIGKQYGIIKVHPFCFYHGNKNGTFVISKVTAKYYYGKHLGEFFLA